MAFRKMIGGGRAIIKIALFSFLSGTMRETINSLRHKKIVTAATFSVRSVVTFSGCTFLTFEHRTIAMVLASTCGGRLLSPEVAFLLLTLWAPGSNPGSAEIFSLKLSLWTIER